MTKCTLFDDEVVVAGITSARLSAFSLDHMKSNTTAFRVLRAKS